MVNRNMVNRNTVNKVAILADLNILLRLPSQVATTSIHKAVLSRCNTNRVVVSKATPREEERPAEAAAAAWALVWQLCAVAASLRKVARHAPTVLNALRAAAKRTHNRDLTFHTLTIRKTTYILRM